MNEPLEVVWLGNIEYQAAWDLQNRLAALIADGERSQTLLLLEHPHVFTIGRRGGHDHLLWDQAELHRRGVDVVEVDRGGDITYHGPGQLVGYPLLRLSPPDWHGGRLPQADFVGYVRRLEQVIIRALAAFSVHAVQREGLTGVWVNPSPDDPTQVGKIASIGVKVDGRGISRHGFALNVEPAMDYWQGIIPCGLDNVRMLSMADLIQPVPTLKLVADQLAQGFADIFGFELVWKDRIEGIQ